MKINEAECWVQTVEVDGYNTGPEADEMNDFLAAAYESVIHDPPGWRESNPQPSDP